MKEKNKNCKYCGGELEAKTTRREFCSNKCKVYWFRENKADEKLKKEISEDKEITKVLKEINERQPEMPKKLSLAEQIQWKIDRKLNQ